jgi:hypothetical protein
VQRDMEPITSLRMVRKEAYFLWKYRNKVLGPDFGAIALMKKEFDGEIIFKPTPA